MFLPRSSNVLDVSNIDLTEIIKGFSWIFVGKALDYTWKKFQIPIKARQFYFESRGLKYQLLFNYESWKLSKKRGGSKFVNYPMSKMEQHYFCQMLISDMMANPEKAPDGFNTFGRLFQHTYPKKFRELFGETKSEVRSRLNIEQFFLNVFA